MDKMNTHTDQRANRKAKLNGICRLLSLAGIVLLLLTACSKDDPYKTSHPDKGAVKVTTDWSGASSDAMLPENYILRIGTQEQTVSGASNVFNALFEPTKQELLVCHSAKGITRSDNIATVNTLPDGTLEPMPGYLFSASRQLDIVKDDTLQVNLKMEQRIRNLTLSLKLKSGDEARIASVTAALTGITSAIDLRDGATTATEGKTVAPAFVIRTDDPKERFTSEPALVATLRLLGVMTGKQQQLTLVITLTDGYVQTITDDLSEALKDFGDKTEPLELEATLGLPAEGGFTATITDWTKIDNGQVDIH